MTVVAGSKIKIAGFGAVISPRPKNVTHRKPAWLTNSKHRIGNSMMNKKDLIKILLVWGAAVCVGVGAGNAWFGAAVFLGLLSFH